ncbi:hypothetical protein [Gilliamella apis]|uniref:hypothetical protein n=1 Tax=Gilliamella apis TaxID=1970738 RepID=UPI000A33155A|nr:hypothetical protein [Gilliamella apis]OTQ34484.1 hypothetical protein B6C84_09485 [Gilliamella apis]OTQ36226.1 hypothetical protein B6C88_08530 [Gilliamella apis]OTQ40575.1 hypothetical protein B6C94_10060 [Gilliamella apis]OTQ40711.1 hypothetical protein B6D26_04815 [Gilliamella apis]OTQ44799.1 hypothetical protein B6C86_09610 [Gilliamella apis]
MKKANEFNKIQNFDDVIIKLHHKGLSIIDSIKFLKNHYGLTLKEAKEIVDKSPVWTDIVEHSNKLIDNFLDKCEKNNN